MSSQEKHLYKFGSFRVNPSERLLLKDDQPVRIPLKTFELLLFFVQRSNQIISKETLMEEVWRDSFVEDANLTVHISTLRKILASDSENSASIETFPRRGYRFSAEVSEISEAPAAPQTLAEDKEEVAPELSEQSVAQLFPVEELDSAGTSVQLPTINKQRLFLALLILIFVAGSGYVLRKGLNKFLTTAGEFEIKRVLGTEKAVHAAISPNGEYLAQIIADAGKRHLQITHLATGSSVDLTAPANILYSEPTFSKDGNYIYFAQAIDDESALYKIPFLGGDSQKILTNIAGAVSHSPDGSRIAFVRIVNEKETAVVVANADGTSEQVISMRQAPEYFPSSGVSWSPNGKTIASVVGLFDEDQTSKIVLIDIENGQQTLLSEKKWEGIYRVVWSPDGSGLFAATGQIWFLPVPSGEAVKITNDLNSYDNISLTADSKTLAAIQTDFRTGIWLVPENDFAGAKPVSSGNHGAYQFVSWTSDNRILFGSSESSRRDIWIMDSDGGNQKQLTANSGENVQPIATPDNRYIVFLSNRSAAGTFNIWRMNMDGSRPVQLTFDHGDMQPTVTPDGKWIIYSQGEKNTPSSHRTLWKISIDGGDPVQLNSEFSFRADVSPDGSYIVCWLKPNEKSPPKAAILPIEGGEPVKFFDIPPPSPLRWTPDGSAVSYIKTINGVSNIWNQPVSGAPAQQITQFTSEQIMNFDWSKDNQLICSRGRVARDVVLISEFKK